MSRSSTPTISYEHERSCERNPHDAQHVGRAPAYPALFADATLIAHSTRTSFGHAAPSANVSVQDTLIRLPPPS
jgi:hypothetical protein